ncbi:MAG: TIGR00730 family Rossman fold protein [Deltaproteobacteria bacterium]|nr:TIGR00730 family Rossman fold protein [Deltaproteobacteria bacterium]
MSGRRKKGGFPTAQEDARAAELCPKSKQTLSPSYRLAFRDHDFLLLDELRPVRLQLELLKPELILNEHNVEGTVVVFGGARIPEPEAAQEQLAQAEAAASQDPGDPSLERAVRIAGRKVHNARYYGEARRLATLIAKANKDSARFNLFVVTGGGPGIMEAANRGAHDVGAESIGLNIVLPFEQRPNPYITPELCFQFHYFAIRKMHFLMRAKALVVFPGGYGTLDELFETLTLIQTRKITPFPVLIFGKTFWEGIVNFDALVEEGVISPRDIDLFQYVETAEEAWSILSGKLA